jgi:hypothetical protein
MGGWVVGENQLHALTGLAANKRRKLGEVEGWRDSCRCGLAESGPFVCRCLNSLTLPRFHTPAYRTGQAQLTHPALGERFTPSPTESWRSAL